MRRKADDACTKTFYQLYRVFKADLTDEVECLDKEKSIEALAKIESPWKVTRRLGHNIDHRRNIENGYRVKALLQLQARFHFRY